MRYRAEGVPLLVIAGREYGSGSSRDWAAKGTALLGIRAVIAESYERIHRSNLVGMGVLPLQFLPGESAESLGLTGLEAYTIHGLATLAPRQEVTVDRPERRGRPDAAFRAIARLDGPIEVEYLRQGGILPAVLRRLARTDGDRERREAPGERPGASRDQGPRRRGEEAVPRGSSPSDVAAARRDARGS